MKHFNRFYKATKELTELNDTIVSLGNGYTYVISLKPQHKDTNYSSFNYYNSEQLTGYYGTSFSHIKDMLKNGTLPRNIQGSLIKDNEVIEVGFLLDDTANDMDPEELAYMIADDLKYFRDKYC